MAVEAFLRSPVVTVVCFGRHRAFFLMNRIYHHYLVPSLLLLVDRFALASVFRESLGAFGTEKPSPALIAL